MTQINGPNPDSLKTGPADIRPDALRRAAGRLLGAPVSGADYQSAQLHGGTLGDVQSITGNAKTADDRALPFRLVLKTQKQWLRPGDPGSWRREYDLYQSELQDIFTESFRRPRCYGAEEEDGEIRLWLEYIDGPSGARLTLDDLALAAAALGRFQGRCHTRAEALRRIACLSDAGYMERDFAQWTPDTVEYRWLRSADCALPDRLRQLLIDTQAGADAIFGELRRLPQVLCHRDYWTENIFVSNGGIVAIDWDCAGWGPVGEDIASLIADETDAVQIGAYCRKLVPAYLDGLAESMDPPRADALPIREMILLKFGYRLMQQVMFAHSPEPKAEAILALEQIAAIRPGVTPQ